MMVRHDSSQILGNVQNFVGVVFNFSLFNSRFDLWTFLKSFILELDGQIGDLCDFCFTIFIFIGVLRLSMDICGEWPKYLL